MPRIQHFADQIDLQLSQEDQLQQNLVSLLILINDHLVHEDIELLRELKIEVTHVINLIKISQLYCTEA